MTPLVNQVFNAEEAEAIRYLWKNPEDRKFILESISTRLIETENIVLGHALNQVCLITSRAKFADSEQEPVTVAAMIFHCLTLQDVMPSLLSHRGKEFASRALVSLSLFRSHLDRLYLRHGAPKSEYYREVSKIYLKSERLEAIAEHHILWESFLAEHFA